MTAAPPSHLPYGRQTIDDDDIAAVTRVLKSDFLTTGPETEAFEEALARQTGAGHALSFSSGTAALHLAALALDLGPGDLVVVPTITFLATVNAARYVGAVNHSESTYRDAQDWVDANAALPSVGEPLIPQLAQWALISGILLILISIAMHLRARALPRT